MSHLWTWGAGLFVGLGISAAACNWWAACAGYAVTAVGFQLVALWYARKNAKDTMLAPAIRRVK